MSAVTHTTYIAKCISLEEKKHYQSNKYDVAGDQFILLNGGL